MSTTQRQKLEAKEAAILAAAHAEFADLGFEGARMASIAKRASVAEGTLYLYYRNKAELLEAVVAQFWRDLTSGAREAVASVAGTQEQLAQLARYHLIQVMADFDFVGLTSQVRQHETRDEISLTPIREYVRVFDEIFDQGQVRGEIKAAAVRWQWRDLFYGQLEYSARTLILRASQDIEPVLNHLEQVIEAGLLENANTVAASGAETSESNKEHSTHTLTRIEARLAAIEARLP